MIVVLFCQCDGHAVFQLQPAPSAFEDDGAGEPLEQLCFLGYCSKTEQAVDLLMWVW